MPNIKAKNYYGEDVVLNNVDKVWYQNADNDGNKIPYTYGEAVSKTLDNLNFRNGEIEVPIDKGELVTKITIPVPENLTPNNIPKGIVIAGIEGIRSDGGIELEPVLKYFKCQIDVIAGTITLYELLYDLLYEDTGSCDITIPNKLGGLNVVIACE